MPVSADVGEGGAEVIYRTALGDEYIHDVEPWYFDGNGIISREACWQGCSGDWPGCRRDCPLFNQ